ncbi:MAG: methylated-DNA--[protein]-cysteine S-methyltransferase [Anaerolineae bacterium]|nr:methylated-DNA--[protein]-cysteine S-methyltransferase [Anaerolineae bacterium]
MTGLVLAYSETPLGALEIAGSDAGIRAVRFLDEPPLAPVTPDLPAPMVSCIQQLAEYFAGQRRSFEVPLDLHGTPFQRRVWELLLHIPFGETRTYLDIALALGDPKAVRAVGAANGQNPVPIIVPCHRVIGGDGALIGYGGGLWRKEWLLAHEGRPVQAHLF